MYPMYPRSSILIMFVSGGPDSYCYEPIFFIWLLTAKTSSMCTSHISHCSFTLRKHGDIEVYNCDIQSVQINQTSSKDLHKVKKKNK